MEQIGVGDLVWRENQGGVFRVLGLEERTFRAGDWRPVGARLGDAAPPHAVLERVLDADFRPPRTEAKGYRPRRAGAAVTALRRVTPEDLAALVDRVTALAALLP